MQFEIIKGKPILPQITIPEEEALEALEPVLTIFDPSRIRSDMDYLRASKELGPDGTEKLITISVIARRTGCTRHSLRR